MMILVVFLLLTLNKQMLAVHVEVFLEKVKNFCKIYRKSYVLDSLLLATESSLVFLL